MKLFLLFLILVQISLQQEWSEVALQSGVDFAVAMDENRTLITYATNSGLYHFTSPYNGSTLITTPLYAPIKTHLVMKTWNGTWILASYNNRLVRIYRTTDKSSKGWTIILGIMALESEIALESDHNGGWYLVCTDVNGNMKTVESKDDGIIWTGKPATEYSGFSSPSLTINGLLGFSYNGYEILKRVSDGTIILNVSGSGSLQVASLNQTILFLSGSGSLYVSKDQGVTWALPIQLISGTIRIDENGSWIIFGMNSTLSYSTDNGQTWIHEDIGIGIVDKIDGTSSEIYFLRNGMIYMASKVATAQIILLNESIYVTSPLVVNKSLIVEGLLTVEASLQVNGELTLTDESTLNLSNQISPIEVVGEFTAAGRLIISSGIGTIVLVKFNSSQGNFSQIEGNDCARVEYSESSLIVVFSDDCQDSSIKLWMIILIVIVSIIALTIATILIVFFRKKIAPNHGRQHYVFSQKKESV